MTPGLPVNVQFRTVRLVGSNQRRSNESLVHLNAASSSSILRQQHRGQLFSGSSAPWSYDLEMLSLASTEFRPTQRHPAGQRAVR